MKMEHLGKIVDMSVEDAAIENRIVLALRKYGPLTKSTCFHHSGNYRVGREPYDRAIQRLVEVELLKCSSTTTLKGFVLSLTPWGEQQAETLAATIAGRRDFVANLL